MEEETLEELKLNIESATDAFKSTLKRLRTGRANAGILDGIRVDYFGSLSPLSQCANITIADARTIIVKPWDKSIIADIERAISQSDIGINPQNDGDMIRLPIPPLTEERRKDLVKQAKGKSEDAKISIRNARRDANDMLKEAEKEKEISQDELKRALEKVQGFIDSGIAAIDEITAGKEKDIMAI